MRTPQWWAPPTLLLLLACSGGGSPAPAPAPAPLAVGPVDPAAPTRTVGTATVFSAAVTGSSNPAVTWSASGGSFAGSTWTAPATPGTYTITATSVADPTKSAHTTATVVAAPVISSFSAAMNPVPLSSGTTLVPTFSGGSGVIDQGIGNVTSGASYPTGILIAPRTYTLTVTNAAGDSTSSQVMIGIQAVPVSVNITPVTRDLPNTWSRTYVASVTGSANTAVTWSVVEPSGGVIDDGGTYTAPGAGGTYTVRATSQADPTKSATTSVHVVAGDSTGIWGDYAVTRGSGGHQLFIYPSRAGATYTWSMEAGSITGGGDTDTMTYKAPSPMGYWWVSGRMTDPSGDFVSRIVDVFAAPESIVPTGTAQFNHFRGTTTLLADGRVLLAGGGDASENGTPYAEIYDPASGTFAPCGSMSVGRFMHTATLLANGKVLIAGGVDPSGGYLASAELFDPATGSFAPLPQAMNRVRTHHGATRLQNGKVLLAGGVGAEVWADGELYDPATGTFSMVGPWSAPAREVHLQGLQPDGSVLIAGGAHLDAASGTFRSTDTALRFDPATSTFSTVSNLPDPIYSGHMVGLENGQTLGVGYIGTTTDDSIRRSTQHPIFFPTTQVFALSHRSLFTHSYWTALAPFQGGYALLSNGYTQELFDGSTGIFRPTVPGSTNSRVGHAATVLGNGDVLISGGKEADLFGAYQFTRAAFLVRPGTAGLIYTKPESRRVGAPNAIRTFSPQRPVTLDGQSPTMLAAPLK